MQALTDAARIPSVSELTESYETADQFTREVAQIRSAVAVPANNVLRYAGHHLLQALDGQEQISKPDGVRKAKNHPPGRRGALGPAAGVRAVR